MNFSKFFTDETYLLLMTAGAVKNKTKLLWSVGNTRTKHTPEICALHSKGRQSKKQLQTTICNSKRQNALSCELAMVSRVEEAWPGKATKETTRRRKSERNVSLNFYPPTLLIA